MKYSLEIRAEAIADVIKIVAWYDNERELLGEEFIEALYTEIDFIKNYPTACRLSNYKCRERQLKRFPFAIVFRLEKTKINVVAIMHIKRDPDSIKGRI